MFLVLSIPGIFGVPKVLCADMYVKAAADFGQVMRRNNHRNPCELHFIDVKTEILDLVKESVKKWKDNPDSINHRHPKYKEDHPEMTWTRFSKNSTVYRPSHGGRGHWVSDTDSTRNFNSNVRFVKEDTFAWKGKYVQYNVAEKLKVLIFKGEVHKSNNVCAVVCGLNKQGDKFVSTGFIADALKNAGFTKYKESLQKKLTKHEKKFKSRKIFRCNGGDLKVKHVIHVHVERVKEASENEVQEYRDTVLEVLKFAAEKKCKIIVLPMIGTGRCTILLPEQ